MAAVAAMSGQVALSQHRVWKDVRKGYTRFQDGDVLIAKITPCMENGKIAVVRQLHGGVGAGSTEFHVLRPTAALSADLLRYYALREEFRKAARAKMIGTAGQLRVPGSFLEAHSLPIPPLREQQRIVEAIESHSTRLDDAVATLKRVQRNLDRYLASVLKVAVEGQLVPTEAEMARAEGRDYEPASVLLERLLAERRRRWQEAGGHSKYQDPVTPDTTDLPELPEGWCWTTVDAIGDVLLGRQRAPQYLTGRWPRPYLRVANIKDDAIDFSDVEEMDFHEVHFTKYTLAPGDILLSEGQSPELLGQSAIYRGGIEGLCFQKTLHRFRPVPGGPSSEFAQLVFRAHVKTGVFKRLGSITTNIAHLTLEKFKQAPFPLPPTAEQSRIVAETERILTIADAVERSRLSQAARLDGLRQSILKWAFEGKLADQDPCDEPASALLERIRSQTLASRPSTGDTGNKRPRRSSRRQSVRAENTR
jgi:type I restriction enzyme S subunit